MDHVTASWRLLLAPNSRLSIGPGEAAEIEDDPTQEFGTMNPSHPYGIARRFVAILAAISFVMSPLSALAQQPSDAPEESDASGDSEGDESEQTDRDEPEEEDSEAAEPAGPKPEVMLLPTTGVQDEMSSIVPERVGDGVRSELEGKGAIVLLPDFEKSLRKDTSAGAGATAEAEKLYTSGIGLLGADKDEEAAEAFQEAVDLMEDDLAGLENFAILSDAYKNLALAYFKAGYDFDSRKQIKVFAHLEPEAELDPEQFPEELRELYDDEAGKVLKGGPGKLLIEADVEDATVFIDGEEKGEAPLTVDDVGYGYHYLVVRAPDGSAKAEEIRVRGRDKEQTFTVDMSGAEVVEEQEEADEQELPAFYSGVLEAIQSGSFGVDLRPYLEELVGRSGADHVAWIAVVKRGMKYEAVPFVYRASDHRLVRPDAVEFNAELSNLRVGVNRLGARIVEAVEAMPEEQQITSVQLVEPPTAQPQAAANQEAQGDEAAQSSPDKEAPTSKEEAAVAPPPEPSEKRAESNRWLWVGAGSAAVLVTGLVVGGVIYMSDSEPETPDGFDAALSW